MARQLWLLRHADAEPHGTRPDAQRRLTERGERQARVAGLALARMGARFERLLTSPKERAQQTATLAARAWSERAETEFGEFETHGPLAGGYGARQALAELARLGADGWLLAVGHEPDLSNIVGELTGARIDLKKGGVAVVRIEGPGGELVALLRPRELALIAEDPGGASETDVGRGG